MPDTPENLENMTDQELLHEAVRSTEEEIQQAAWADEPEGEEPPGEEAQPSEQPQAPSQQPRNERGQFTARDQEPEQQEPAEQGEPEQQEQDEGEAVPRWRMREIAEERRQEKARYDAQTAEMIRMQTRLHQLERQQPAQQPQQQDIDPLLDPTGYANRIRSEMQREIGMIRLNSNLEIAHLRHGETFEKAYEALVKEGQRGNGQIIDRLTQTANPGEAIVRWYKERELMAATGGDLNKFRQTMRDEMLNDPEFLQKAIEVVRAQATGEQPRQPQGNQQSGRPNNITRLPPSLSRAPGGSPNLDPNDTDDSDRAVFDYAFRN